MVAVLFTMLFQSVHIYRHWIADASATEKKCQHETNLHHHAYDDCGVCDFSFWYYVKPAVFHYLFYFPLAAVPYLLKDVQVVTSFSGSLFALRGPPVIV